MVTARPRSPRLPERDYGCAERAYCDNLATNSAYKVALWQRVGSWGGRGRGNTTVYSELCYAG
ncbi:hypothetical protein FAGKG844_740002 [Frankia sp. AgKG'84/4]